MFNFGARSEGRNRRRAVSYYLDVYNSKYQYHLLNPNPFYCITVYIMEDAVVDRYLKSLPQRKLNLIDGSISR